MRGSLSIQITLPDGVTLEVEISGPEVGEAVVLIPGAGAPLQFWPDSFVQRLAATGHMVVRYCHRDTGLSDHFDDPYDADTLLADLRALLVQLGVKKAHAVGHSMGGFLACLEAATRPDAFASVTAISAGPSMDPDWLANAGIPQPTDETWEILLRNQPTGNFENDLPGWLSSWRYLSGKSGYDESAAISYTKSLYRGDPRNHQVATNHMNLMANFPSDFPVRLKTMKTPLFVVHGCDDPLVPPENGSVLADLVEGARQLDLPGIGHMIFQPETWNHLAQALETWFGDLARPTRAL